MCYKKAILQRVLPEFVKAFLTFVPDVVWFHGTDTNVMKTVGFRESILTKHVSTEHHYMKICHGIWLKFDTASGSTDINLFMLTNKVQILLLRFSPNSNQLKKFLWNLVHRILSKSEEKFRKWVKILFTSCSKVDKSCTASILKKFALAQQRQVEISYTDFRPNRSSSIVENTARN